MLPDAATNTVALLFGQVSYGGAVFGMGQVANWLAFVVLAGTPWPASPSRSS